MNPLSALSSQVTFTDSASFSFCYVRLRMHRVRICEFFYHCLVLAPRLKSCVCLVYSALAAGGGRDVPRGPVLLDGRFLTCWRNLHSEPSCHVGEVALRASCKKNSSNNFNSPLNVNNVDTRGVNKCAAGGLKSMRGWLDWIPGQPSWFPPSCLKSVPILGEGR